MALCISQKCKRKMLFQLTAASQSTSTVERPAKAMEPDFLLWVGNKYFFNKTIYTFDVFLAMTTFKRYDVWNQNICLFILFLRPYGVHPVRVGQFPVWWSADRAQCGAALHRFWISKPYHPMVERWSTITSRLPLDTPHYWPHHLWLETRGQWQLHLWGYQQLWLQGGGRSPQCNWWVARDKFTWGMHFPFPDF